MLETNHTHNTIEETLEKTNTVLNRIFVLGDLQNSENIKDALSERPLNAKTLVRAGLALIYKTLPEDAKNKLREKAFENSPLDIQEIGGYRILPKIGYGGINSVYLISQGNNEKSYSIGLCKKTFKDIQDAWSYAKEQKLEYEYFKEIYKEIPELVQNESYVLYERHDGIPSVMFVRDFVPGPLHDVFTMERQELSKMLDKNPYLADQILKFTTVSMENYDAVVEAQLDLVGVNNLAIAGRDGQERLILLDPHKISKESQTIEYRQQIYKRIQYLQNIVEEKARTTKSAAHEKEMQFA